MDHLRFQELTESACHFPTCDYRQSLAVSEQLSSFQVGILKFGLNKRIPPNVLIKIPSEFASEIKILRTHTVSFTKRRAIARLLLCDLPIHDIGNGVWLKSAESTQLSGFSGRLFANNAGRR